MRRDRTPEEIAADDPPEYPGLAAKTKELRRKYPHVSRQQAHVMAATAIAPERNSGAKFIGWDQKRRPVFERTEYGKIRIHAQTKAGDPTESALPIERATL